MWPSAGAVEDLVDSLLRAHLGAGVSSPLLPELDAGLGVVHDALGPEAHPADAGVAPVLEGLAAGVDDVVEGDAGPRLVRPVVLVDAAGELGQPLPGPL